MELGASNLLFLLYLGKPDQLFLLLVQAFFKIFNPVFLPSKPSPQGLFRQPWSCLPLPSSCPLHRHNECCRGPGQLVLPVLQFPCAS